MKIEICYNHNREEVIKLENIKKTQINDYLLPNITTTSGTYNPNTKKIKIEDFNVLDNTPEIYRQENLMQNKILPGGIAISGFNSAAFTIVPYEFAKKTGTNITSVSQLLPDIVTSSKVAQTIKSLPQTEKAISFVDDIYTESIKGANQFYNAGNFAAGTSFGEKAFAEIAEQTGAKIANPTNILKTTTAIPNVVGAAFGGVMDTTAAGLHYYEEGGLEEVGKHKGELGGRLVGSTAGTLIGTTAATAIGAAAGGMATGAMVGGVAGSVVPIVGNVVGALAGCVIGAVASTFLGDIGAEIGANLFDNGG